MSDNPYLPEDLAPEEVPPTDDAPGRPGCLSVNFLTVLFLALTLIFLVYFGVLLANPYLPINPFPPRTPLPVYVVASPDPNRPTDTPQPTPLPPTAIPTTRVPVTARPTESPTPPETATPTLTPPVIVSPPGIPTGTIAVPSPTLIAALPSGEGAAGEAAITPPPVGDATAFTPAAYPFTVYDDAAATMTNPNDQGCRWASIAGTVTNLDGVPMAGLAVHVTGEGVDEIRFTGTAPLYGPGGYEVFLNGAPVQGQYEVQLLSQTGSPISAPFTVTTVAACEANVTVVNFVQNHTF